LFKLHPIDLIGIWVVVRLIWSSN